MSTQNPSIAVHITASPGNNISATWLLWILVSVVGAVLGAIAAWWLRSLFVYGPSTSSEVIRYVATIAESLMASGCQWLLLRRFKLDVYWWVPATVAANLISAILVISPVLRLFTPPLGVLISPAAAIVSGAAALGAAGLVVGTAQALVLRPSVGNIAWGWVPASVLGGALAGASTEALSLRLGFPTDGLSVYVTFALLAVVGSFLKAASQAPIVVRILR